MTKVRRRRTARSFVEACERSRSTAFGMGWSRAANSKRSATGSAWPGCAQLRRTSAPRFSTAANRSTFAPATRAQHDPEHPLRQDVFGITFRVDLVAGADSLTFVLHRGDSAETGPEQALVFTTFGHEVWQLEGAGSAESLRGSTRVGRRPPRANGSRPDKSSAMGRTRARRARPARSAARIP
jgi:hypothetical protein